ncbi:MAG: helix-turn-helix transcriptional regulator [Alistipes senegalensis]|nr:helix-turn-helix transcriptional regulator [Oxalobacter formigenes]MCM1280957.1 helix-turn-helix transcriptional regulator [Alistipes senegalensis]
MRLSTYGLCVRKLRLENGLSLRDMAQGLGISSPYLSAIELGERGLTEKISKATLDYFSRIITVDQQSELWEACRKTMDSKPVSKLNKSEKDLVAAFARRLTDGQGVPDDIVNWINGGRLNNDNNK